MLINSKVGKIEQKMKLLQKLKPDSHWKSQTRAYLLQAKAPSKVFPIARWALIPSFLIVFLLSATSLLAAYSLPGEPLYPLKRTVERLHLAISQPEDRLTVQNKFSQRRINELRQILTKNSQQTTKAISEVKESVADMKVQIAAEQKKLTSQNSEGKQVQEVKETLVGVVAQIEQKQSELVQIELEAAGEERSQIQEVIRDLEEIKESIVNVTDNPEVKGTITPQLVPSTSNQPTK